MQANSSVKSGLLSLVLVVIIISAWEFYLRMKGFSPDYNDGPELWANKRDMVYEPSNKSTVFIGSSRIKFDLDIPTWEGITGNHAIQLAMVGSSPCLFLDDLANDPNFKGKLIVDVTETLFFNHDPRVSLLPQQGIDYYKKRTPAQRVSFYLERELESRLTFLDQDNFSLNALLNKLHVTNRAGVNPTNKFPKGFHITMFNRQTKMSDEFVKDTSLQNGVKNVWHRPRKAGGLLPISGKDLDADLQNVKNDVDKIKARGGEVIFLRTPSSGLILAAEKVLYPKANYWDKLLTVTQCKGIYFADYPAIDHFVCPELSHLSPSQAVIYTKNIINILENEKGWKLKYFIGK